MSFGFHDADREVMRLKAISDERARERIEWEQAAFDEWCEEQSRIPGSGVYRV